MKPDTILFPPSEWVPNNPHLPVLVYRSLPFTGDVAAAFEARFAENDWRDSWRNGVFAYQHYHTHAHEVLGIAAGEARLLIGGPTGRELDVAAGDCLVLPAGTGHMRLEASADFLVVGAYPPDQQAGICTDAPGEAGLKAIAAVLVPEADPILGRAGGVGSLWPR